MKVTYYIDKYNGETYLSRRDRTYRNQVANNKGMAIGMLVASLINEIELMGPNDSLAITVSREG